MAPVASSPRSRVLTIWFVAMLLLASAPMMLPTAQANHGVTIEQTFVNITKGGKDLDTIVNNSQVTFRIKVATTGSCTGTNGQPTLSLSIPAGPIGSGNLEQDTATPVAGESNKFWLEVTTTATKDAPVTSTAHPFPATVTSTCGVPASTVDPDDDDTTNIIVPVQVGTVQASAQLSLNSGGVDVPSPAPTHAGIGAALQATITLNSPSHFATNVTNVGPATVTVNLSSLGKPNLTYTWPNGNIAFNVPLNESATIDGPLAIPVVIKDAADNYRNLTLTTPVDTARLATAPTGASVRVTRLAGAPTVGLNTTWTATTDVAGAQLRIDDVPFANVTAGAAPLTINDRPNLIVGFVPFDDGGNLAHGTAWRNLTPPRVTPAKYNTYGAAAALPVATGSATNPGVGNLVFTLGGALPPASTFNSDVTVTLFREGKGYWNGVAAGSDSNYHATNVKYFHLASGSPTNPIITVTAFANQPFPDGLYHFNISVNGTEGIVHYLSSFKVDAQAPDLPHSALTSATTAIHGTDGNPLGVWVFLNETREADSRFANVTIELTDSTRGTVVSSVTNPPQLARINLVPGDCGTTPPKVDCSQLTFTSTNFNGQFVAAFPNLTVGDYFVRIIAKDIAGNERVKVFDTPYQVRPRVAIKTSPTTPFLHASGIEVYAYSAFESATTPTGLACDGTLCTVRNVTYYARNLADTAEVKLGSVSGPLGGKLLFDDGIEYYNFSTTSRFPTTGLRTNEIILIRAEANININGVNYASTTPWLTVQSLEAPSLAINKPAGSGETKDWIFNTTGTVPYNATFEYKVSDRTPVVNYTLHRLGPGAPCVAQEGSLLATPHADGALPKFLFNYTGTFTGLTGAKGACASGLANAEYQLHIEARDNGRLVGLQDRFFAVQTTPPSVTFPLAQNDLRIVYVKDSFYTRGTFDMEVVVDHGVANITSDANFSFRLRRVEILGDENELLVPGDGSGFQAIIKNHSAYGPEKDKTYLNLSITLPTGVTDGRRFILEVNATTDVVSAPPHDQWNTAVGIGTAMLQVDTQVPAVGVFPENTNATGLDPTDPLTILGFAEDAGSGIARVEARIVNLDATSTFFWNLTAGGLFRTGEVDSYMTSDLVPATFGSSQYVRNIQVANFPTDPTRYHWDIPTEDRVRFAKDGTALTDGSGNVLVYPTIPLNRFDRYRIDVRAVDHVGQVSAVESFVVEFDPAPPVLHNDTQATGGLFGDRTVNWHSRTTPTTSAPEGAPIDTIYATNVADNHCLKRVVLKGLAPSGVIVTADFDRPAAAACGLASSHLIHNWTINLVDHPHMTNEIGQYTYWVSAEDHAGRAVEIPSARRTFVVDVVDTRPATIKHAHFEPPVAQVGGSARLIMEVEENHQLASIQAYLSRVENNRIVSTLGPATPAPTADAPAAANGTGTYILDLAQAFNVSLQSGEYLAQLRVRDASATGCSNFDCLEYQLNRILVVTSDAGPSISIEAPAATAAFVNATPEFRFRVEDPTLDASGIQVLVGATPTNLAAVNATLAPISIGGNVSGYRVTYRANLTGMENATIRVHAADRSNLVSTVTHTFRVDSVGPDVEHNVTGTRLGADNLTYATRDTRISINASDNLSGLQGIAYTINGGTPRAYTGPFSPLGGDADDGPYTFVYGASDNASNVATGTIELRIDTTGPVVTVSSDGSTGQEVAITVRDDGIGVNESSLFLRYAYGNASAYANASFAKVSGNLYSVTLPGNSTTEGLRYYIESRDLLGNAGPKFSAANPFRVNSGNDSGPLNAPPVVVITAPTNNTSSTGEIDLRWTATDADGDAITITIALREPEGPGRVLIAAGENSGSYAFNTTGLAPGAYALVVTATDEVNRAQAEVSFRVPTNGTPPPNPVSLVQAPPANATTGQAVTFAVQIDTGGKQLRNATFTIVKDGRAVGGGALVPLATGLRGSYVPTESGQYSVLVSAAFTDGTNMAPTQAATFSVQQAEESPIGMLFPTSLISLLAAGVLTIALAAYAAFGRWRK